jgi:hypothetical protein
MAKEAKKGAKKAVNLKPKKVTEQDARAVKGGRKAGKGQQEYLVYKVNDATITG